MSRKVGIAAILLVVALGLAAASAWYAFRSPPVDGEERGVSPPVEAQPAGSRRAARQPADPLERRFRTHVRPFLERYCFSCHGAKKPEASLDLSRDATVAAVAGNARQWEMVLERVQAEEMPPEEAPRHPKADERAAVV